MHSLTNIICLPVNTKCCLIILVLHQKALTTSGQVKTWKYSTMTLRSLTPHIMLLCYRQVKIYFWLWLIQRKEEVLGMIHCQLTLDKKLSAPDRHCCLPHEMLPLLFNESCRGYALILYLCYKWSLPCMTNHITDCMSSWKCGHF